MVTCKCVHSYVNRSSISFIQEIAWPINHHHDENAYQLIRMLAQVEHSMKSTVCVCILKLKPSDSRFKLFYSCILIMAKPQAKRKMC